MQNTEGFNMTEGADDFAAELKEATEEAKEAVDRIDKLADQVMEASSHYSVSRGPDAPDQGGTDIDKGGYGPGPSPKSGR
jgi:hypothetical protein